MHQAIRDDRLWFQRHPTAIVRFRKAALKEFTPLELHGDRAPIFRPSFSQENAHLGWVAVVDLMQLLGSPSALEKNKPTARLRLRIPVIRSKTLQRAAKQEIIDAVSAELLAQTGTTVESSPTNPVHNPVINHCITDQEMAA